MDSHYSSPSSSHRGEWAFGSDGATRSDSSSPAGTFASYTQPQNTTTPSSPTFGYASGHSSGFSTQETRKQLQNAEPLAKADWDPRLTVSLTVPLPLDTLIIRLNVAAQLATIIPKMKAVNEITKSFRVKYAAHMNDDWSNRQTG